MTAFEVDVVLPVLNEAASLPGLLARMPSGMRAIVVDNGSTDGSALVASALGVEVVMEPIRGFGAACFAGLTAARAPVVAFMDADSSMDPEDLHLVVDPVRRGDADLMLGSRDALPGSWPWHARVANRGLVELIRRRTGLRLRDLGPMRAAARDPLLALGMADRRSGWPLEMVLRAHARGWRIDEVPVSYRPRVGRSKVTGTVRGTVRAVSDMTGLLRQDW